MLLLLGISHTDLATVSNQVLAFGQCACYVIVIYIVLCPFVFEYSLYPLATRALKEILVVDFLWDSLLSWFLFLLLRSVGGWIYWKLLLGLIVVGLMW
jgi:hypothetical protein